MGQFRRVVLIRQIRCQAKSGGYLSNRLVSKLADLCDFRKKEGMEQCPATPLPSCVGTHSGMKVDSYLTQH